MPEIRENFSLNEKNYETLRNDELKYLPSEDNKDINYEGIFGNLANEAKEFYKKAGEYYKTIEDIKKFSDIKEKIYEEDHAKYEADRKEFANVKDKMQENKKSLGYNLAENQIERFRKFAVTYESILKENLKLGEDPAILKVPSEKSPNGFEEIEISRDFADSLSKVFAIIQNGNDGIVPHLNKLIDSSSSDAANVEKPNPIVEIMQVYNPLVDMLYSPAGEHPMDECMKCKDSEHTFFYTLYSDLLKLCDDVRALVDGNLVVPEKNEKTINGKKIHIVDTRIFSKDKTTVVDYKQPKTKAYKYTDPNGVNKKKHPKFTQNFSRNWPLFTGIPKPEDVVQGTLGDCYVLAGLTAIAAQNPMKIMEMMHDNHDGSVTVRFYNHKNEPYYVTVDKTLPTIEETQGNATYTYTPYAQTTFWPKLIEKAFAASQLHNIIEGASLTPSFGKTQGGYGDIECGTPDVFVKAVLGGDATSSYLGYISLSEPKPGKEKNKYTPDEEDFFKQIKAACDEEQIVTTGTHIRLFTGSNPEEKYKGLIPSHAYTIMRTEEDLKTGAKYIVVRNPHAEGIRTYDENGNPQNQPIPIPGEEGISHVELHDFEKTFTEVYIGKIDLTISKKQQLEDANMYKRTYGDIALHLSQIILDNDNYIVRLNDSDQFKELWKKALIVKENFNKLAPNKSELEKSLTDLTKAAKDYHIYRDNKHRPIQKEQKRRTSNRYYAAEMLCNLDSVMSENARKLSELANPVSLYDLERRTLKNNYKAVRPLISSTPKKILLARLSHKLRAGSNAEILKSTKAAAKTKASSISHSTIAVVEELEDLYKTSESKLTESVKKYRKSNPRDKQLLDNFYKHSTEVLYYGKLLKSYSSREISSKDLKEEISTKTVNSKVNDLLPTVCKLFKSASDDQRKRWINDKNSFAVIEEVENIEKQRNIKSQMDVDSKKIENPISPQK